MTGGGRWSLVHVIDPRVDHRAHHSREPEFLAYLTAKGILWTVVGGIETAARQLQLAAGPV